MLAGMAWLAVLLTPPPIVATATPSPPAPHVMVIVEENRSAQEVLGSNQAPYINALAGDHGLATDAYATSHPSLPNYLELISGSTHGVSDDGTGYRFAGPTLVDQLSARGIGWRAYMEAMPSTCYDGAGSGGYAKKHDPFMYFTSVTGNATACAGVVPFSRLRGDLAAGAAPPFLWITPSLCDDGHDCSTATADSWLAANLPAVLASSWYADDGIVIITWDEGTDDAGCCGSAHGGRIATIVVSSRVTGHVTSASPVDHSATLRSIEAVYGLPFLGDAACACSGDLLGLIGSPAAATNAAWTSVPRLR